MMMHEPAATHTDPELVDKVRVMMQKQAKYHADKVKNGQQKQQSSDMPMPSFNAQRSISISTMRSFWLTWMGSMVDTLKLQPQLVSVAAHFMDVAVGCTAEWNAHDISDLQHRYAVMAVTSFITAIKLHQPQRILICSITRFSPVPVTDAEVVQMEVRLYEMMDYRLHPPTAEEFAELFVGFLPQSTQSSQHHQRKPQLEHHLMQLVHSRVRVATIEDWMTGGNGDRRRSVNPSVLAYACMLLALEHHPMYKRDWHGKRAFCMRMRQATGMSRRTKGLGEAFRMLKSRMAVDSLPLSSLSLPSATTTDRPTQSMQSMRPMQPTRVASSPAYVKLSVNAHYHHANTFTHNRIHNHAANDYHRQQQQQPQQHSSQQSIHVHRYVAATSTNQQYASIRRHNYYQPTKYNMVGGGALMRVRT
mmetsp:Transcript_12435/g.36111  ORF Transcript_12435/g.36111 Transcript_12435/m.36111 type:complete len:418 (+) Transcript_12435:321-1574(+)